MCYFTVLPNSGLTHSPSSLNLTSAGDKCMHSLIPDKLSKAKVMAAALS